MSNSDLFSQRLRDQARLCRNANAAALLQEVAAWMFCKTIFDEPQELWEHADRLCGGDGVKSSRCPQCGGVVFRLDDTLCECGPFAAATITIRPQLCQPAANEVTGSLP